MGRDASQKIKPVSRTRMTDLANGLASGKNGVQKIPLSQSNALRDGMFLFQLVLLH